MTKFVLWPVVDRTPLHSLVLYIGHSNLNPLSSMSSSEGFKTIKGKSWLRTFGYDSPKNWVPKSHQAPSMYSPPMIAASSIGSILEFEESNKSIE